jgi:type IV secretory pathway VirB4 component
MVYAMNAGDSGELVTNVLITGKTGSGKSSFINFIERRNNLCLVKK